MGLLDRFLEKQRSEITKAVTGELVKHVESSLSKAGTNAPIVPGGSGVKRYAFTQDQVNGGIQSRKKPGSSISFETLRRFSVAHEVSRACVNYRKRQITGMEWQITTADDDETGINDGQQKQLEEFFKNLGGRGIGYRRFMDRLVEDLMVLDAITLEKQGSRGGKLANLVPIDAATIRIRVDESGATPEPPETAYVQVIRGTTTAEFTDDEMIYGMMNARNDSPYGLAPLESLMIIVSSSLKSGMYNLAYLTDGNIPEGIYQVPESWQPDQIKQFQEYFDALMAGDETMTSRLKFLAGGAGAGYIPTKKRDEMAFKEFNDWLMKITCALFEVQPIEIGFAPQHGLGGKGFAEGQQHTADNKGLLPLALFIEEMFTKVIQEDLGFSNLKFTFPTLKQKDEKAVAEVNAILLNSGQRTVNELRTDDGLDPIPGLDKPFVQGQITFIDEESQNAQAAAASTVQEQLSGGTSKEPSKTDAGAKTEPEPLKGSTKRDGNRDFIDLATELRTFRKYALGRAKAGKSIRKFESAVLPEEVVDELNYKLQDAKDVELIKGIFHEYMTDYQINIIESVAKLKDALKVS
jgi:HK97 family phage portal protein